MPLRHSFYLRLRNLPCLLTLGLALVGLGCQRRVPSAAFWQSTVKHQAGIICLDNTMHLTTREAVIDSVALVRGILDFLLVVPENRLLFVVYFNGAGPKDISDARVAGLLLKKLLVKQGYPDARIDYTDRFYRPRNGVARYPYRKVDLVVTKK